MIKKFTKKKIKQKSLLSKNQIDTKNNNNSQKKKKQTERKELNEKGILIEKLLSKFQYFLGKFYKFCKYEYIYKTS